MTEVQYLGISEHPPAGQAHVLLVRRRSPHQPTEIVITMSGTAVHSHSAVAIAAERIGTDLNVNAGWNLTHFGLGSPIEF